MAQQRWTKPRMANAEGIWGAGQQPEVLPPSGKDYLSLSTIPPRTRPHAKTCEEEAPRLDRKRWTWPWWAAAATDRRDWILPGGRRAL